VTALGRVVDGALSEMAAAGRGKDGVIRAGVISQGQERAGRRSSVEIGGRSTVMAPNDAANRAGP
jgi:hypothetical protein